MKIAVNGQQYVWRYGYPGKDNLLVYTRHGRPGRHDRAAGHHRRRRRPLLVDPEARRQVRRGPGLHEQDLVPDPAGCDPKEGQKQVVFTGQCAELCGRNHANMYARVIGMRMADYKKWYADKVQAVKDAPDRRSRSSRRPCWPNRAEGQ